MIINIDTYPKCILIAIVIAGFLLFAILATDASRHDWNVCIDMNHFYEGRLEYIMIVLGIFITGYVFGKFSKLFSI